MSYCQGRSSGNIMSRQSIYGASAAERTATWRAAVNTGERGRSRETAGASMKGCDALKRALSWLLVHCKLNAPVPPHRLNAWSPCAAIERITSNFLQDLSLISTLIYEHFWQPLHRLLWKISRTAE